VFFFVYWAVLTSDFFSSHKLLRWIQYVQYFVLAGYIFSEAKTLFRGGKALMNRLFDVLNTTFLREFTYYNGVDETTAQADILIFLAILLLLYSGILLLSRRHTWMVLIETMPVVILLMIFAPQAVHGNFFAYFAGLIGMYFLEHSKEKMAIMGFAFMIAAAGFFVVYPSTEIFGENMTSVRQGCLVIAEYANHVANGKQSVFTLNFGDLKNEATKKTVSNKKLTVRMKSVENALYLRSYVGKEYKKGKWIEDKENPLDSNLLEDYEMILDMDKEWSRILRPSMKQMEISYENSSQKVYPYYMIDASDSSVEYLSIRDYDQFLSNAEDIVENKKEDEAYDWEFENEKYEKIKSSYTKVSKGLNKDFLELAKKFVDQDASIPEKVNNMKLFLKNNYTYTSNAGMTPQNEDPTAYFLLQSKRGDASQYASAAVLLLRSMDIPARYVEGYQLNDNDFNDATMTNGKMVLSVGDDNAYAWAEIYMEGIGWIPIDSISSETLVAASDAREIELPSLPKLTMTPAELANSIGKGLLFIIMICIVRVMLIHILLNKRKEKMSRKERILWYARIWDRYKYTGYDEEIQKIIEQAKYSNHPISKEQEDTVYKAVYLVRADYRRKLPLYMNLYDMFIVCRDIL
jgi:hypothetical protein